MAVIVKDADMPQSAPTSLLLEQHAGFIAKYVSCLEKTLVAFFFINTPQSCPSQVRPIEFGLVLPLKNGTLSRYGQDPDDFEYAMSEFLRMNGMYWGVACMDLIDRLHEMNR